MSITLPAPAKINLHLFVTGILDNGMHELDTSFAYIDICDELTIENSSRLEVTCSNPALAGKKNLVYKLLDAFKLKHNISAGLSLHITKHIPEQAGLGGGSSDAATALLAANRIWKVYRPLDELIDFAAPFGADIPCFLYGKASIAHGIGERLSNYPESLPDKTALLVWPGTGLATSEVFQHFDQAALSSLTQSGGLDTIRTHSAMLGKNDLEASACSLSGDVSRLLTLLREKSGVAWMSGSGSTCIALFDDASQAHETAQQLRTANPAFWVHIGKVRGNHPLEEKYWDVAKR